MRSSGPPAARLRPQVGLAGRAGFQEQFRQFLLVGHVHHHAAGRAFVNHVRPVALRRRLFDGAGPILVLVIGGEAPLADQLVRADGRRDDCRCRSGVSPQPATKAESRTTSASAPPRRVIITGSPLVIVAAIQAYSSRLMPNRDALLPESSLANRAPVVNSSWRAGAIAVQGRARPLKPDRQAYRAPPIAPAASRPPTGRRFQAR